MYMSPAPKPRDELILHLETGILKVKVVRMREEFAKSAMRHSDVPSAACSPALGSCGLPTESLNLLCIFAPAAVAELFHFPTLVFAFLDGSPQVNAASASATRQR